MTEKSEVKKQKSVETPAEVKTVRLQLNGELKEFSIDEPLPEAFLESKLKENQKYIPINLYRDIMRQIDEFGIPNFSDAEKIITGKNKTGTESIAFRVKCECEWNRPGKSKPTMLRGDGYHAMSGGVLLSDAIHGNMKTLQAKAMRDMLKYAYKIFEYPEADLIGTPVSTEEISIIASSADKVLDDVAKAMPDSDIKAEIQKEYEVLLARTKADVEAMGGLMNKKLVLSIATELKTKFGEENKPVILEIITDLLNKTP